MKTVNSILLLLFIAEVAVSQDGKLRGKVTDKETGEPLPGAKIVVESDNLETFADINGEYFILGVPTGDRTVTVTYIGYSPLKVSGVRVDAGMTTTQDLFMASEAIQMGAVEIVASRPLIQRNTINTIRIVNQEGIKNLPLRASSQLLSLSAGVVSQDGNLYLRGSRAYEIAYFVDGASVTNPFFGSSKREGVTVVREAIDQVQLQTGGYASEYGSANAGILSSTLRTGGDRLKLSMDYETDDFAKPGERFLGTSSFGFRNIVATASGPIFAGLRFFLAGQNSFLRTKQAMYLEPFRYDSLKTSGSKYYPIGTPFPGPLEIKRNYLSKNWDNSTQLQGTFLIDLSPFKLHLSGSYMNDVSPWGYDWGYALDRYYELRTQETRSKNLFGNIRLSHVLSSTTFYELNFSYSKNEERTVDPDFDNDFTQYTDSVAARSIGRIDPQTGSTDFRSRFIGASPYITIVNIEFNHPFAPINTYSKSEQRSLGMSAQITSQISPQWELKAGGRLDSWVIRNYSINDISSLTQYATDSLRYMPEELAASQALRTERDVFLSRIGKIENYGYDVDGNPIDIGVDGAPKPLFASAYLQNKIEFRDLVINAGLRYEFFDTKLKRVRNFSSSLVDLTTQYFENADSALAECDPVTLFLPRIGFSFPVSDKTIFYTMWGRYAQMPQLGLLYRSSKTIARALMNGGRVGFFARPERTTQYEMGIRQSFNDKVAFTLTCFYKDISDQIGLRRDQRGEWPPNFLSLQNDGYATSKGLELTIDCQRTNRLSARLEYTLSDTRGTEPLGLEYVPRSLLGGGEGKLSSFILPLDFDQTHRGTIILDYRFATGDGGPILEGIGTTLVATFNSGHAYTKRQLVSEGGNYTSGPDAPVNSSSTPWVFNLHASFNKTFFISFLTVDFYVHILNLLDTKSILNVFSRTGTATSDGWPNDVDGTKRSTIPMYEDFYRNVFIVNRYQFMRDTGDMYGSPRDIYGPPRQIRVGVRVEM